MTFSTPKTSFHIPGDLYLLQTWMSVTSGQREPLCFAVHVHISMKAPSPWQGLYPNVLVSMFPGSSKVPNTGFLIMNDASYLLNTRNQCSGHFQPPGGRRGKSKPRAAKDRARRWTSPFLELTFHTSNNKDQIRCFQVIIKCTETYWWRRRWVQHILGKNISFFFFLFCKANAVLCNLCVLRLISGEYNPRVAFQPILETSAAG